MANIIDALVITLGLDHKQYDDGQKEVNASQVKLREESSKTVKEMSQGQKKLTEGLVGFKTGLLEVIALFAAGIGFKDFVLGTMNSQASLGRLSTNLNTNARDLKAWGILAEEAGGKAEDAYSAFNNVQRGIAEAKVNGHSAFTDLALRMGFQITPEMIKTGNLQAVMGVIAKKLQSMPRDVALLEADQLGVGSMANVLLDKNYDANLAHAKTLTGVTDESTRAAMRLQKSWVDFTEKMEGVKDRVWMKMEPVIERLGNQFAHWVEGIDWDRLIDRINAVADAFGGWKTVGIALGAVLALQVLSPIISLISSLTRLAPLLLSTKAGLLGVAAAGGAFVGSQIYKATEGTPLGDSFGKTVAAVLAVAGNKEAIKSVERQEAAEKLEAMNPAQRAEYDRLMSAGRHPASNLPRGIRNNNPGNLNYVGQPGAHLESLGGRFAAFDSMDAGIAALQIQLARYMVNGTDTIRKIVNKYAPGSDNNDVNAYIADLTRQTGDKADQKLSTGDLPALMRALINHENGKGYVGDADIQSGLRFGARQRAMANGGSSRSSEVHIQTVQVNAPQAKDAHGIARGMQGALQANPLLASSDTGLE